MPRSRDHKENTNFDFLFVVPGVAIGLAIFRVCQFFGHLLVYKKLSEWLQFPAAWTVIWSAALLGYSAQYWFFQARRRKRHDYSQDFGTYLCILLMPVLISFMSFILCPSYDEPGFKNLGMQFEAHSNLLYLLIGISFWAAAAESLIINEARSELAYPSENIVRCFVGLIFALFWFAPMQIDINFHSWPISLSREWTVVTFSAGAGAFRLAMNRFPI